MADTVCITGANRGLGLEFARQYVGDGWSVIATARDPDTATELMELAEESGDTLRVLPLDVSSDDSVRCFAESLDQHPLDLLINNAGTMGSTGGIEEIEPAEILRVFDVNVLGSWRVTRALLPCLIQGAGRKIAFITSMMGSIGDGPGGHYYPYRISKSALNMLGANLAADLRGRGIVTVLLHPGWVRTRMGGASAPKTTEDSVSGMRTVLDRVTLEDTGRFFHAEGHGLPW